jgi:hypothetical protein
LFGAVLIVQSVPFLSAVGIALLERSRVNDYAFWQAMHSRTEDLLQPAEAQRALVEVRVERDQPLGADKRADASSWRDVERSKAPYAASAVSTRRTQ